MRTLATWPLILPIKERIARIQSTYSTLDRMLESAYMLGYLLGRRAFWATQYLPV